MPIPTTYTMSTKGPLDDPPSSSPPFSSAPRGRTRQQKLLGYVALLLLIVVWVAQSEVAQLIQTRANYNKPYMVSFINHAFMALVLPMAMLYRKARGIPVWGNIAKLGLAWPRLLGIVTALSAVYFFADYAWYTSLTRTSVTVGTVVFNSNCVFVYLFSIFLLRERVTVLKVLAVLVASGGVVCLAMAKTDNKAAAGSDTIVGPILCALAACLYAVYEVRRGMREGGGEGREGFRCSCRDGKGSVWARREAERERDRYGMVIGGETCEVGEIDRPRRCVNSMRRPMEVGWLHSFR